MSNQQQRKPFIIRLLMWGIFLGMLTGLLRLIALPQAAALPVVVASPFYPWLIISGGLHVLIGLPTLWGLWRGKTWAASLLLAAAVFYPLAGWFEWLFLYPSADSRTNGWFMLLMTVVWAGLVVLALFLPASKRLLMPQKFGRAVKGENDDGK